MNKEYFIEKAKNTPTNYRNQGIIFVGENPRENGLGDFIGYHELRGKLLPLDGKGVQNGGLGFNYYIDATRWRKLFGPLPWGSQDKESEVKNKISNLKEELARAESELAKLEEEKRADFFKGNDTFDSVRGKKLSNGARISDTFGSVRLWKEYKNKGFYLGSGSEKIIVKWKIVEDEDGAQILVPDLKK